MLGRLGNQAPVIILDQRETRLMPDVGPSAEQTTATQSRGRGPIQCHSERINPNL